MARNKSEKETAAKPWDGLIPRRHMLTGTRPPSSRDDENDDYSVGSIWIDTAGAAYVCTGILTNRAEWVRLGSSKPVFEIAEMTKEEITDLPSI